MAQLSRTSLRTDKNSKFADNTSGAITAANLREYLDNSIDSTYNLADDNVALTAAGTNDYTANDNYTTAYATGQRFTIIFTNANTGAVTLNINGLGSKAVKKNVSTALVSGDIPAGRAAEVVYDGTNFQFVNSTSVSQLSTFDVTITGTQILSLNSSPITLVAAGGSGTYINIVGAVTCKYTYNTAAFATNINLALLLGSSIISNQIANVIDQTANAYGCFGCVQWQGAASAVENQPLRIEVATGNPTGGNASASLRVIGKYEILTY